MTLPVLVAVVVAGVSLIVLAVHLSGGTRSATLASEDEATNRFLIDYPDARIARCDLSADGGIAVLALEDGTIGLVHPVGSHYLTRHVSPGGFSARIDEANPTSVRLKTGDLTWPRAILNFEDAATAKRVAALFDAPDPHKNTVTERAA